jgi:hypothetical protein
LISLKSKMSPKEYSLGTWPDAERTLGSTNRVLAQ